MYLVSFSFLHKRYFFIKEHLYNRFNDKVKKHKELLRNRGEVS